MTAFPWNTTGTPQALESSGAGISAGAAATATTEIDNTAARDDTGLLVVVAALASAAAVGDVIDAYLVPIADLTNAASSDTSTPTMQQNHYVGSLMFTGANTSAQRMTAHVDNLLPIKYATVLVNRTSKAVSSAWTAAFYSWRHASA